MLRSKNADPKDHYYGEKECPVCAANRFRQVVSLPTYGILRKFHGFWLQTDRNPIVSVVSPLNALIRGQETKPRDSGLKTV